LENRVGELRRTEGRKNMRFARKTTSDVEPSNVTSS
jgi:hypothetical protein